MLRHLDPTLVPIVRPDASMRGIGAVLLQKTDDGVELIVAFASQPFNSTQRNWSTIEQEGYAIVFACKSFRHFLIGRHFVVECDHRNLMFIARSQTPKVVRWRLLLREFDYEIRHIPGKDNTIADALSRVWGALPTDYDALKHTRERRTGTATGSPQLLLLNESTLEKIDDTDASVMLNDDSIVESDVVQLTASSIDEELTKEVRVQRFKSVHNAVMGHRGVQLTLDILTHAKLDWPGMRADVETMISACPTCQKTRFRQGVNIPQLHTTESSEPFEIVSVDFIGPLPADDEGRRYILVTIDCFTRFVELFPTCTAAAQDAAEGLLHVFGRYGQPRMVRSDQGPHFAADIIVELLKLIDVSHQFTLAYRPQANGIVERAVGETMRHLRAIVMDQRIANRWSHVLPLVQRIINSTPHSATGVAPAKMLFGGLVTLERGLLLATPQEAGMINVAQYVDKLSQAQSAIISASQKHQEQVMAKRIAGSPASPTKFAVGDYVVAMYPKNKPPTKLHPRWMGPFRVRDVEGQTYKCQDLVSGLLRTFHLTRLRAYDATMTIDPVAIAAVDSHEYIVEGITAYRWATSDGKIPRNKRDRRNKIRFRVAWLGYDRSEDTWEPLSRGTTGLDKTSALDEFLAAHPELDL